MRIGRFSLDLGSFDLFEIARLPTAVKRRPFRPIDAEVAEPSLARDRPNPAALIAGSSLGTEEHVDRLGTSGFLPFGERAQRRATLRGLNLGASDCVVDSHRPEQVARHGK